MDLLKTLLVYMSLVFATSVQNAPEPTATPEALTPTPPPITATVTVTPTAAAPVTPTPTPVPTPAITPNNDYKTIKTGDRGDLVRALQARLAELGYFDGEIDGAFGNQTRRAVEKFQYQNGLSADGIAGKRTLTVLYESKDVVLAPTEEAPATTLAPSATPKSTELPTAAPSPAEDGATPAPTFVPSGTPAPDSSKEPLTIPADTTPPEANGTPAPEDELLGEEEVPQGTPIPDSGELGELIAMEGYTLVQADGNTPMAFVRTEGAEPQPLPLLKMVDDTVFVPLMEMLREMQVTVVPANTSSGAEYAFVIGNDIYRIAYTLDEAGAPTGLVIEKNGAPMPVTLRVAKLRDGVLYLPMLTTEEALGLTYTADETALTYTVALPAPEA